MSSVFFALMWYGLVTFSPFSFVYVKNRVSGTSNSICVLPRSVCSSHTAAETDCITAPGSMPDSWARCGWSFDTYAWSKRNTGSTSSLRSKAMFSEHLISL